MPEMHQSLLYQILKLFTNFKREKVLKSASDNLKIIDNVDCNIKHWKQKYKIGHRGDIYDYLSVDTLIFDLILL